MNYISLLRGINVSGQKKINMQELKKLYESLGFTNVQTYIQSGNVVFASSETSIAKLQKKIEKKIKQSFGFDVLVFIRTKKDLERLIKNNKFPEEMLYVTFLSAPSSLPDIEKFKAKDDKISCVGKEIYVYCPGGYGKTKLSNNFFEKKLGVQATTRNWNTVKTLFSMA